MLPMLESPNLATRFSNRQASILTESGNSAMVRLRFRHENRIVDLYRRGELVDCNLLIEDKVYRVHKLVLAKQSEWFAARFAESPSDEIRLDYNPGNIFPVVLEFLYTGRLEITVKNWVDLRLCAGQYGIKILKVITRKALLDLNRQKKVDHDILKRMTEANLLEDSLIFKEKVAHEIFADLELQRNNGTSKFSIFNVISILLFSAAMNTEVLRREDADTRVELIDMFTKGRTLSTEDTHMLYRLIDWKRGSFKLLLRHDCSWIPPAEARQKYMAILKARKRRIEDMKFEGARSVVNRWAPFQLITEALKLQNSDERVINYIGTLGGSIDYVNPVTYGWIGLDASPSSTDLTPQMIFMKNDKLYYMYMGGDSAPYVKVDFGKDAILELRGVRLDCTVRNTANANVKNPRQTQPRPTNIAIKATNGSRNLIVMNSIAYPHSSPDEFLKYELQAPREVSSVTIEKLGDGEFGSKVFRVKSLEFLGEFKLAK